MENENLRMEVSNVNETEETPSISAQAGVKVEPPKHWFVAMFDYLEIVIIALCIVFLTFTFAVRLCNVSGPSMEKTLFNGDKILVSDCFYTPKRGDIVVFHQTVTDPISPYYQQFNETIIKRVIGLGGDHIVIDYNSAKIYVNGEELDEPYLPDDLKYIRSSGVVEYDVPAGQLFVLGDNRNNSTDSRSGIIGFVDERQVLGRVITRIFPNFGTVD